jgi:hypothetical protein
MKNLQLKASGSVPLKYGFTVSPTVQNLPGANITATWAAPNSAIALPVSAGGLGRNLASCGTAAVCNGTFNVPLIQPNTMFEPRRTQVDLRFSKSVRLTPKIRSQWNVDVYNVTNNNAVTSLNTQYGLTWLKPTKTLDARLVQIGGRIDF